MVTFAELGLAPSLLRAVEAEGYSVPTPIQVQAIPAILAGRDVQGIAQTGTGKTAAFALPILHRLLAERRAAAPGGCRVLVLGPTRELVSQIAARFGAYGKGAGVRVAAMYGGVPKGKQAKAVEGGVDVLVATPGRLMDHMHDRAVGLAGVEVVVLDEADQMLDLGFIEPIRRIVSAVPRERQCLLFSATMPGAVGALAGQMLRKPVRVAAGPAASPVEQVRQLVVFVEAARKRQVLAQLLKRGRMARVLVFTRTKSGADRVAQHLEAVGESVATIHGDKTQPQRERALAAFKGGRVRVLVATDVAARGIDVEGVTHVVNFELPDAPEAYVHRVGRTARAGRAGVAISLCGSGERGLLRGIEGLIGGRLEVEEVDEVVA